MLSFLIEPGEKRLVHQVPAISLRAGRVLVGELGAIVMG